MCNRSNRNLAALAIAALSLTLGCVRVGAVETGEIAVQTSGTYNDDRTTIQMVSTLIGGKNVFVPSTVVLSSGTGRSLTIYNTTDIAHGFRIPALGIEVVLKPGEETVVALPPLAGGNIYDMVCHLHPPHRHATLMVVRSASP